jgi:protein gp37
MGQDSKIQWTTHTGNLWWGCVHVHAGCDACYAEAWSKRFDDGKTLWGKDAPRREILSVWKDLVRYQKLAKEAGEIHRVFVGSMMDIFEKPMPLIYKGVSTGEDTGVLRSKLFQHIDNGDYPNLLFLFLTKRPSNINKYIPESWRKNPPANVMFGTSPVDQATADTLIPQLLRVNGKRFLSVEPQLAELSLSEYLWQPEDYCEECGSGGTYLKKPCDNLCGFKPIFWIINGGESGPHKRPFNVEWARKLKAECELARVPYFFKQIDKIQPIPEDLQIREFPS